MVKDIDLNNLTIIPDSEVPEATRKTVWNRVFEQIPKNQALVLEKDFVMRARQSLHNWQKKGKFTDLVMVQRDYKGFIFHKKELGLNR